MLLCSIQKTANFQHNEDNALSAHSMAVPDYRVWLAGGLSVVVCCVGMAVPLNRTRCSSPPLFCGGNSRGNIATQLNTHNMKKIYKVGIGLFVAPIFLVGVLFTILLIWGAIENHNIFSKDKLEELTNPNHYITGITSSEMEEILCQVEAWADKEEKGIDEILDQSSKAKQQSMAIDYIRNYDYESAAIIKNAIRMLNCTDFQYQLSPEQQERKKIVYEKIHRQEDRLPIIKGLLQ